MLSRYSVFTMKGCDLNGTLEYVETVPWLVVYFTTLSQ
jgi:hypothetical protein